MFICNACNKRFARPKERCIDAGGIRDFGAVQKHKVPIINFCPNCSSRNFTRLSSKAVG